MDRIQAEQLAKQIEREDPRLRTEVRFSTVVGEKFLVVAVIVRATGDLLQELQSPSGWDKLRQILQNHP